MCDKAETIKKVFAALLQDDIAAAKSVAREQYPFIACKPMSRSYTELQSAQIFLRDGFIDRYSGQRLVFPAALRLLSTMMPDEFPAHPNWKMSESHIVYWELFPTIDHVYPIARGGEDADSNWVTTSMLRNAAKSNWTLEELGWKLLPTGNYKVWDGLVDLFLKVIEADKSFLKNAYIARWHRAVSLALGVSKEDKEVY